MNKKYQLLLTGIFTMGLVTAGTYSENHFTSPVIVRAATSDNQLPSEPAKLTKFPQLTNFYAENNGAAYIYTNLTATLPLYPYNSERKSDDSELYGFYVVLPKTLSTTLTDAQKSADQYLETLRSSAYNYTITSLKAYDLGTTKDGTNRQVFYFQPNVGANDKNATTITDSTKWPVFNLNVKTGTDEDMKNNPTISFNANNNAELKNDILFAGANDFQSTNPDYPTLTTSNFINGAPDKYIAGISYNGIQRQLTYISSKSIQVQDTFLIKDAVTHSLIKSFKTTGTNGTTFKAQDIIDNFAKYGVSLDGYNLNTLKLYNGDVNDPTGLTPIGLDASLTYTPSIWGNSTTMLDGSTYTFFINSSKEGQIKLDANPTYIIGNKWDPKSYIESAVDIDGTKVDPQNITIFGGSVAPTKIGTVPLTYAFKDKNGNTVVAKTNVNVRNARGSLKLKGNPTFTLGSKWGPKSYIESAVDVDGTTPKDIKITGDTKQPTTTGIAHLTFQFVDKNGNKITQSVDVKINSAASGGSGTGAVTSTSVTPSVNSSSNSSSASNSFSTTSSSNNTVVEPDSPSNYAAQKGAAIYAIKPVYLYRSATFKKTNRVAKYPRERRVNRPEFVVKGYKRDTSGKLRYFVQQYNPYTRKYIKNRKGYVTASTKYVQNAYYATFPKQRVITVINRKGIVAYRNISLKHKVRAFKKGAHLRVRRLEQHGLTTRYQLTNGNYVTANKKFVIIGKY